MPSLSVTTLAYFLTVRTVSRYSCLWTSQAEFRIAFNKIITKMFVTNIVDLVESVLQFLFLRENENQFVSSIQNFFVLQGKILVKSGFLRSRFIFSYFIVELQSNMVFFDILQNLDYFFTENFFDLTLSMTFYRYILVQLNPIQQ